VSAEVLGQQKLDGGLDVLRAEGSLLLVSDELGGFEGNLLEHVSNEGVDDVHTLLGDTDVVGDALEDLVDVEREGGEVLSLLLLDLNVLLGGALSLGNHDY